MDEQKYWPRTFAAKQVIADLLKEYKDDNISHEETLEKINEQIDIIKDENEEFLLGGGMYI